VAGIGRSRGTKKFPSYSGRCSDILVESTSLSLICIYEVLVSKAEMAAAAVLERVSAIALRHCKRVANEGGRAV